MVLLSGGLDSATTLAVALREGRACQCLSFDYGQRHRHELDAARRVAHSLGQSEPLVVPLNLRTFGGSALTADIPVPRAGSTSGIPLTYVPARNLVFLSIACALAEVIEAGEIYIGVNAIDYSGYPDCRPEFVRSFEAAANLATRAGVSGRPIRIRTPLIDLSKAEIIRLGASLGVDFALTHSCYDPDARGRACGNCDSCTLRRRGFEEAGVPDPTVYAS
ncbi:MAG: 7-cyano-7-deazaguanine synthase QueC [Phycisphaerales bacterium]